MAIDTGDTAHLHIEFYIEAQEDEKATREQGRPIFRDVEMVRIRFVGDPKKELVAPAHDKFTRERGTNRWVTYAEAYFRHYDHFKTGQKQMGEGFTPLEELPFLNASKRAELKALNIHTAEGLAQLEGAALTRLGMFGRQLKDQSAAWIAKARDSALETRLSGENAELKARLEQLEKLMMERAAPVAAPTPAVIEDEPSASRFDPWADDDLKKFIKERTGQAPRGTPSHATLIRMAEEALESEAA